MGLLLSSSHYLFLHHIPLPKASHINMPDIKGQENMYPTRFSSSRSGCSQKVKKKVKDPGKSEELRPIIPPSIASLLTFHR